MFSHKLQSEREQAPHSDPRDLPGRLTAARQGPRLTATTEPVSVLVVDANERVRCSLAAMLATQGYDAIPVRDAREAHAWLAQRTFDILLADRSAITIGLAGPNEVSSPYPDMVSVLVSTSDLPSGAREAVEIGANDFVTLPCNQGELAVTIQRCLTRRALQRKHAQRFRAALESSNENVLDTLLTALNTRDTETQGHTERVTAYTMEIADFMHIPPAQMYHIERGALLHDIGKIGIPDRILHKPASLTEAEWAEMRKHPVIGYQMCAKVELLRLAAQVVLRHHERWDGTGYPDGLAAEAIPIGARIFAVADALDAMTSDRPHRPAIPFAAACREIARGARRQFDPAVVRVFLNIPEARWSFIRANAAR